MTSETNGPLTKHGIASFVRELISVRTLVMLLAGVLAGYSISVLGEDAVVVPLVGSVPGTVFGVVGVAVALAVSQRGDCYDDCGEKACGCTDECGDSCSYDP
ncbi:hypothetical protein [Halostella pelagica]|uniref:hypothetical protein n=1 Tax=Halostella pelagica TaxID=2583824 RepID=UPI001080F61E|nr:hypothetical protein [Halostella pelagica]